MLSKQIQTLESKLGDSEAMPFAKRLEEKTYRTAAMTHSVIAALNSFGKNIMQKQYFLVVNLTQYLQVAILHFLSYFNTLQFVF